MALKINSITLQTGILLDESYSRIDTVCGSKESMQITLNFYIDQSAFTDGKAYVKQGIYTFVPSVDEGSANFIKQGYEYLKTLTEFSDAENV